MGYSFRMEHANLLAKLTIHPTKEFLTAIETLESERQLFTDLLYDMEQNIISSDKDKYQKLIREITNLIERNELGPNEELISRVKILSRVLRSFEHKFMILKPYDNDSLLAQIVDRFKSYSVLILQPRGISLENFSFISHFNHLDMIAANYDELPAVLYWKNGSEASLIRISEEKSEKDIIEDILSKDGHKEIIVKQDEYQFVDETQLEKKPSFIFHVSDLHIGLDGNEVKLNRFVTLMSIAF